LNPLAKAAAEAAKKAAQSKAGRKAIQSAAGAVGRLVTKGGSKKYGQWQGDRKQRELAYKLARQVHGQLSEAVFVGSDSTHLVVWKDDVPLAAFPAVEGDLAKRAELKHVAADERFEPPAPKTKRKKG
jgi:hypothetical protein